MKCGCLLLAAGAAAFAARADRTVADRAAEGTVEVVSIPWSFPSNRIDWLFNPTVEKGSFNPEWTWQLNRMSFWTDLSEAYRETKDPKYARAFVRQAEDWLDQTGGAAPDGEPNHKVGSPWRTIEEGLRLMHAWPTAYDAFSAAPEFTPGLRRRFVASMRAQANHLMKNRTAHNWLLMEMNGVHAFACRHPEFPECESLRRDAVRVFFEAIRKQALPDGFHNELSPDYNCVFFDCAYELYARARRYGFADEVPVELLRLLERNAEAVLNLMTPDRKMPRFNDCGTIAATRILDKAVELFPQRGEFAWASSDRRRGTPPAGETASRFLPWSGFAVMRSGWDAEATYLAFDVGPLGEGHQHQDKLSFTLWKGGEELVYDDGGGEYERSRMRIYGTSAYDHNTLLVDGTAQQRSGPRSVTAPIDAGWTTTATADRAFGTYDQEYAFDAYSSPTARPVRHRREISYDKAADVFTVTDDVESLDGQPHEYEILFQLDTRTTRISEAGRRMTASYGRRWDLEIEVLEGGLITTVSGLSWPRISGWFVGRNDLTNHVATTASVKAPEKFLRHRFVTRLRAANGGR